MGLCKCPKRQVTSMFCFEHNVNVCEHCVVTNHTKCIVQTYLQWLQDSDYNPICELCSKDLKQEDCIRLICYDVFHWSCLDHYARQLPPTTAPYGYTCPSCKAALFPAPNLKGPVVSVLREKLAGVNWARAGLGLPLLSEDREVKPPISSSTPIPSPSISPAPNHSIVHLEDRDRIDQYQAAPARRIFQDIRETRTVTFDHDEDKYKRRPTSDKVRRLLKNMLGSHPSPRGGSSIYKRYFMLAIILVLAVIVMLLVMSRLGRYYAENDPNLDPQFDRNIRVEQHVESM